ncbi:MAG TPA: hypothetical protein VFJ72_02015 [Rubrobacteraceae bacterium]|nr:hypothetical protein [Rubrobacteraceae bacterium]
MFLLASLVLLSTLISGCGGSGGAQSSQDNAKDKTAQKEPKKAKKKNAPEVKIALGTVVFHNPDTQRFTLRPNKGENRIFRYNKNTKITLNGKEADPKDIEKGLQAQAKYIVKDDLARVRKLDLISKDDSKNSSGGGETTG